MRTRLKYIFLVLLIYLSTETSGQAPRQPASMKGKGVVYQLTMWKYATESIASGMLNNADIPDDTKREVKRDYLKIKAKWDASINQFVYELNRKRGLVTKFNQLNENVKEGNLDGTYTKASIQVFSTEINEFIADAQKFYSTYGILGFDAGVPDPLAVIGQIWTIFKDLKDLQSTKAVGLTAILQELRLSSPSELVAK